MKKSFKKTISVLFAALMLSYTVLSVSVFAENLTGNSDSVRPGTIDALNNDYFPDISSWNPGVSLMFRNPPSAEGRLTKAEGENDRVSLFAPYSNYDEGWLDADKKFDGTDGNLCWAASCSNVLSWYLKDANSKKMLPENIDMLSETDIFDRFRGTKESPVWPPEEGQDPVDGFSWYFTGGIKSGAIHNTADGKGGFLKELVPSDLSRFSFINYDKPERNVDLYGDTREEKPYVLSFTNNHSLFQTYRGFSDIVIWTLHYGPSVLNIGRAAASSHAVTLWGCDYDPLTRLVTGLYLVDNDDQQHQILRATVNRKGNDTQGVEIHYRPKLKDPNQEAAEITGVIGIDFLIPMECICENSEILLTGDINKDAKVTAADYLMLKRALLGTYDLDEQQKQVGDINGDGKMTAGDYVILKRIVLGTYTVN